MPVRKPSEVALRLADENSHVVISVGDNKAAKHESLGNVDDGKPLYLKRI